MMEFLIIVFVISIIVSLWVIAPITMLIFCIIGMILFIYGCYVAPEMDDNGNYL